MHRLIGESVEGKCDKDVPVMENYFIFSEYPEECYSVAPLVLSAFLS